MWKKAKRIISCILALVLLLSMANGQQFFVQAESEATVKEQTKETENKTSEKESVSSKEGGEAGESKEEKDDKTKEVSKTQEEKVTEKSTETEKKEEKSDKEESGKDSEDTSEEKDIKDEDKSKTENDEKDTEPKAEEETTQEQSDTEKEITEEQKETIEEAPEIMTTEEKVETTEEEAPEIATTMEETETTSEAEVESESTTTEKVTNKIKEYVPQEQPKEINVKAYAKEGVFPEGTIMKVRKINKEEKAQAASALKKEVEYDGFIGYDISFYDKEGKEIEPEEGSVKVSMQLKEEIFSEEADKTTLAVQHLDDSKKTLAVQQVASAESGTLEVQSGKVSAEYTVNSFSVFTITWKNNSTAVASLTATCIDTDGKQVTIQYDNQKMPGTINGSSVTYDANKETITEISDVSTLAPTVQNATFLKAVITSRQSTANQNGTEIRYIRVESGEWQYSSDRTNWVNIGNSQLYYIYSKNDVSDSKNSISFAYYGLDEINDMHSIAARDTVKFTISLVDQDGNNETYELPSGSVIPDKYTFHSSNVNMNAASFAQMGITIPGYTYEGGYAYFYWEGNFTGAKFSVSNFKNLGANSSKYGKGYDSYIGYTGTRPGGGTAGYDDYSEKEFGSEGHNYYAYNPTGTLRIVFKKVSEIVPFKSHFVDAYNNETYTLIDTKAMEMHSKAENTPPEEGYYGTLKEITSKEPEKEGYIFDGWYMQKDEDGNGMGQKIENPQDDNTRYEEDAYYYAKWIPETYSLSVKKIVDMSGENNMGDRDKEFTFKLSVKKDNTAYGEDIEGLTKTNVAGEYSFTLKHDQTVTVNLPYKAAYEISESADDYTVQIEAPEDATTNLDTKKVSGTINSEKSIVFTNKKTVIPPTGVNNTMTAWILMTGATLILGVIFFVFDIRRKRLMA